MADILLISVVYEPDTVSTAGIVSGLARGLRDRGHDVSVVSSVPHYNPGPGVLADRKNKTGWLRPYRFAVEDGIRVARCFIPQKGSGGLGRLWGFAVFHVTVTLAVLKLFRRAQVAVVVSPPLTLAAVAFLLKAISGTKVVYNAQELWPDVPKDLGVITNPVVLYVLGFLERAIYRRSDAVTTIGDRFAEIIAARGAAPEQVVVIPNFVDTDWITPRPKVSQLSVEWNVAARPVALYAGNIGLTQDFELVLAAAGRLTDVEFIVVGAGAGSGALAALQRCSRLPNVQLRDYVTKNRVADLYGLADVILVPLKAGHDRTTTPSKIFSAMAAGKPILACAAPDTDLADELHHSAAGIAVPPGDVDAFVRGLTALLAGNSTERWQRDRALASASRHSAVAVAQSYDSLAETLLSSAR